MQKVSAWQPQFTAHPELPPHLLDLHLPRFQQLAKSLSKTLTLSHAYLSSEPIELQNGL